MLRHRRDPDRLGRGRLGRRSSTIGPPGPCTEHFPIYRASRIVAGGPIEGGIFKCVTEPIDDAIARGVYGAWQPSEAERARLHEIFPEGVCDWSRGDAGRPGKRKRR